MGPSAESCVRACVYMCAYTHIVTLLLLEQRKRFKKVGRPIAYKGDPNAPSLTEAERRRIKRRIANRESARRVRARRQGSLEELQVKVTFTISFVASLVPAATDSLQGSLYVTVLFVTCTAACAVSLCFST